VFTFGTPKIKPEDTVKVKGVFYKVRHVGRQDKKGSMTSTTLGHKKCLDKWGAVQQYIPE
jgi:hypothetical protein